MVSPVALKPEPDMRRSPHVRNSGTSVPARPAHRDPTIVEYVLKKFRIQHIVVLTDVEGDDVIALDNLFTWYKKRGTRRPPLSIAIGEGRDPGVVTAAFAKCKLPSVDVSMELVVGPPGDDRATADTREASYFLSAAETAAAPMYDEAEYREKMRFWAGRRTLFIVLRPPRVMAQMWSEGQLGESLNHCVMVMYGSFNIRQLQDKGAKVSHALAQQFMSSLVPSLGFTLYDERRFRKPKYPETKSGEHAVYNRGDLEYPHGLTTFCGIRIMEFNNPLFQRQRDAVCGLLDLLPGQLISMLNRNTSVADFEAMVASSGLDSDDRFTAVRKYRILRDMYSVDTHELRLQVPDADTGCVTFFLTQPLNSPFMKFVKEFEVDKTCRVTPLPCSERTRMRVIGLYDERARGIEERDQCNEMLYNAQLDFWRQQTATHLDIPGLAEAAAIARRSNL